MRRIHYPALLVACFLYGACVVPHAHAGQNAKAPEPDPKPIEYPGSPCTIAERMNVAIVDGMFWECTCVRLHIGYQCDWMLIAGVDARPALKRRIRAHAKHVIVIHALPAVVA